MRKYVLLPYQEYKAVEETKEEENRQTTRKEDLEIKTNFRQSPSAINKDSQEKTVTSEPNFNSNITDDISRKKIVTGERKPKVQSREIARKRKIIIPSDNGASKFWLRT